MSQVLPEDKNALIKDLFEVMGEVLANRDYPTHEHTIRVARISRGIGEVMGLGSEELEILELAGLVHDIGKTGIPDDILLKPDLFNDQDRRIMEFHPLIGAKFFAKRLEEDRITNIILRHHERLDGSGYPQGLLAADIDPLSRITAVADVFEALTAKRPYKKALPPKTALKILHMEAQDHHLDREVVDALHQLEVSLIIMEHVPLYPTAGFMEEVERFRRDTFFRDTLSELYSYRYLLVLDDLQYLGEAATAGYILLLINFKDFSRFQQKIGFIVANQVHDEIGLRLKETVALHSLPRDNYTASIMMFQKHCDYMIYAEANNEKELEVFLGQLRGILKQANEDWGLEAQCFRLWFLRTVAIEEAITKVFSLAADAVESCKR